MEINRSTCTGPDVVSYAVGLYPSIPTLIETIKKVRDIARIL